MFLIEKMTHNTFFRLNKLSYSVLVLFMGAASISSSVYAQVDAGALQQNLERQLPLPSPLALPEAAKPTAPRESASKVALRSIPLF
jgi:hypothetical protein